MSRRNFVSLMSVTAGCSARRTAVQPPPVPVAGRRFARVIVSNDRIIRTVVGLRPFPCSGFLVRTESLGGKTIVHNYGHGGGGITLSWEPRGSL
jgi:hypothetical protein